MGSLVGMSGLLLILLVGSGLSTAIGFILNKKAVWLPSLIILILALIGAAGLMILTGRM